jgi:hypothetical protein
LEALLKIKERQDEETMHINDMERSLTEEMEMLQVIYCLVITRKEQEDKRLLLLVLC